MVSVIFLEFLLSTQQYMRVCAKTRKKGSIMLKNERQRQICQMLSGKEFVTVQELSEKLFISESSIRRDLSEMERKHIVKRSYGGARLITAKTNVVSFGARSYDFVEAKQAIASKAAKLIKEGSIIFLDQSSTSYFLALELLQFSSLTVVSNNLEILSLLSHSELTVCATGGFVSRENSNCLIGGATQRAYGEIFADLMFFSAKAISDQGIISDCTQEEIFVRKAMMKNAARKIFLCDSSKQGSVASFVQCDLSEVDALVCENDAFAHMADRFPRLEVL